MKRVAVDARLCQGHNRCIDIAEDLFEVDDEGYAHVIGDGVVDAERVDRAELAEANCPERAISVTAQRGAGDDG
jgi:ferredoxin